MIFNSIEFLIFYPLVLLLYFVLPKQFKWPMLLAASYIFYAVWNPPLIVLILFTTAVSYISAIIIEKTENKRRKKFWLAITLITSLGVLFFFKYFNFLADSAVSVWNLFGGEADFIALKLILPVGISFDTVFEVISQNSELISLGNRQINARAYVGRFNFSGADQEKKCGVLSGGERNRLHLALALKEEGNVLLLDEPTNDIDVNTLRALEEGLENFAGCAVVISHDRWFLDRVATHILSFEDEGKVVFFEGTYSEYEEHKKAQGIDTTPHRVKYRKLVEN